LGGIDNATSAQRKRFAWRRHGKSGQKAGVIAAGKDRKIAQPLDSRGVIEAVEEELAGQRKMTVFDMWR
jgi:hypothetical protein